MSSPTWTDQADAECRLLAKLALAEDVAAGVDCTTESIVDRSIMASAAFVSRDAGVVSGLRPAQVVIELYSEELSIDVKIPDGGSVEPGMTIAEINGPAADVLTVERTCLNFMGRLSGISTLASRFVAETTGTSAIVLDTRKTTPAWRHLEKYAVKCGGAENHRIGLYDAILIKDNHLAFASSQVDKQSIGWAVGKARDWINENLDRLPNRESTIVQLEVDNLDQFAEALKLPLDIVLLDNMSNSQLEQAVKMRDEAGVKVLLEASGGVSLNTIGKIAQTGVDRISSGALTHSATNFDIGLDWL